MNQEALLEKHYLCVILHSPSNYQKDAGSKAKKSSQMSANNFYLMTISHNDNDSSGALGNLSKKLGGGSSKQAQLIKIKERIDFPDLTSVSLVKQHASNTTNTI